MNYAFYETMNETLILVIRYCEEARNAASDMSLGVNLKMASRAMRCALEIWSDAQALKELPK